jgi:predicted lipoprotein with Yx(FWY)xxD motif
VVTAAAVGLAACGGSSNKASSTATTSGTTATSAASGSNPGTSFSAANVAGLGMVVVDARGHTVYLLTSASQKNVPCDDPSGCTKVWPDLPLPDGVSSATAGSGLQQSLLGTMKLSDGQTYATYGGYLMYEFSGDAGPGEGKGQGIKSFGGTWYALTPAGTPVNGSATGATTATTAKSSGSGGY